MVSTKRKRRRQQNRKKACTTRSQVKIQEQEVVYPSMGSDTSPNFSEYEVVQLQKRPRKRPVLYYEGWSSPRTDSTHYEIGDAGPPSTLNAEASTDKTVKSKITASDDSDEDAASKAELKAKHGIWRVSKSNNCNQSCWENRVPPITLKRIIKTGDNEWREISTLLRAAGLKYAPTYSKMRF